MKGMFPCRLPCWLSLLTFHVGEAEGHAQVQSGSDLVYWWAWWLKSKSLRIDVPRLMSTNITYNLAASDSSISHQDSAHLNDQNKSKHTCAGAAAACRR